MEKFPSLVADIMSTPAIQVDVGTNIRDTALLMTDKRIGSVVVTAMGKPVGIVTKRDIIMKVVALCRDPCSTEVNSIMSAPLIMVSKDMGILAAMRKMKENVITQLVVMDGDKLVGVVSERDMVKAFSLASISSFSTILR